MAFSVHIPPNTLYIFYGYKCTYIWWPSLGDLSLTNRTFLWLIILYWYLFSLSTTSFGHSLYTSDFNGLFYLLLAGELFLRLHVYVPLVTYSVHIPPLGNLFCTYGSFWRLFYTYTSPCLAYSLQVPRLHSYLYTSDFCGLYYFLLLETYHIMTVHVPLVIYSVHVPLVSYSVHILSQSYIKNFWCPIQFTYPLMWIYFQ